MRPLTRTCFLLHLLGRLFLLAIPFLLGICLPSLWSPPFSLHALARLDSLHPHDLVLWTDGSVPFLFGKDGSGVLANCSLCCTEATLSFSAGRVCSTFSAKAYAIRQAFCWSRQHQKVCHFCSLLLLSDFRSVLSTLSSPPSFLLSQTLWHIWQELSSISSCSIRLQWVPGHSFLRETTRMISWSDRERYFRPPQSLVVSFLLSLAFTLVFPDWRRTVSCKFFDK